MPTSNRFRILKRRLGELRRTMLPRPFSPTGVYSQRQIDRARGYRLLAHAEIEAYVEDLAREAVLAKLRAWKNGRVPSQLLVSFIAAYHQGFAICADDKLATAAVARKPPKEHVDEVINLASTQFHGRIEENHGVRVDSLRRMLLPLGVDFDLLDQTWLTNMDEFGRRRGEVAHKTAIGAQHAIDPLTEFQYVSSLLSGLEDLDEEIQILMK